MPKYGEFRTDPRRKAQQLRGFKNVMLYFDGRLSGLAAACKVHVETARQWKKNGCIPIQRLGQVHDLTDIPVYHIRPDLFEDIDS